MVIPILQSHQLCCKRIASGLIFATPRRQENHSSVYTLLFPPSIDITNNPETVIIVCVLGHFTKLIDFCMCSFGFCSLILMKPICITIFPY